MESCFTLLVGVCVSFVLSLREVLARRWVGVCVPLAKFNFVLRLWYIFVLTHSLLEIFAEKRVMKLVEWFSGHCRAIKS